MNDKIYLILKRSGKPLHFTEIAQLINEAGFDHKKALPATIHNELILDDRYVLIGRGIYALREWGYEPGVVRDVIRSILEREEALSREEIIERVKRERYVKDATIAVNLQNGMFMRLPDGKYTLVK